MINVTKPFLPPREEYDNYVDGIWKREWLTNNGPLVNELELRLKGYFDVPHLFFVSNGTIAIQLAIRALGLTGDIITTPFSYVATTSSIVWENCNPVFIDICPNTLNLNPALIEKAITPKTSAILATHVYGNPCDIEAIQQVADKYKLRVVYDGAHAFGSKYKGQSVFKYGDVSTISFHATKLFHTIEGGAIITHDAKIAKEIAHMRNFGHDGTEKFYGIGINGKNCEFHAAMGLCNLNYISEVLEKRKLLSIRYDQILKPLKAQKPFIYPDIDFNHAYYALAFETEEQLLKSVEALHGIYVYPRRYFYPSLHTLNYVIPEQQVAVSSDFSSRILCLPLYHDLSFEEVDMIGRALLRAQNY
ncbi:DegT/DnrJ/EryC1/StrS family aminotransferase [Pontibacter liquoris]|uniref:DegT/DnrJ/EryC1/StrS family aminotransferase n=1 Tax=Pontibacter liquoris TaxID=2905677 RepID=UPI001FA6C8EF|nr:DegT/DnrJ/EryC1/StrS family aminotransferase [Pontibacter liquoris]